MLRVTFGMPLFPFLGNERGCRGRGKSHPKRVAQMKRYLALDISQECGKAFLGRMTETGVQMEVIHTFSNRSVDMLGHKYWDIFWLYTNVVESIRKATRMGVTLTSIGIDTFALDFCCFGTDGQMLSQPFSFLDRMAAGINPKFYNRIGRSALYRSVGMQELPYKTIFQFDAMQRMGNANLTIADKVLFVPDAFIYMLTGEMVCESTMASACNLVNVSTRCMDSKVLMSVGLTPQHFGTFVQPGMIVGMLSENLQKITGQRDVPLVAVASDELSSALVGVPAAGRNWGFVNAGYLSTVGVMTDRPHLSESAERNNLNNTCGAFDSYYLSKTVNGMRVAQTCCNEWGTTMTNDEMSMLARASDDYQCIFDPDDPCFEGPTSITRSLNLYCERTSQQAPTTQGETIKSIMMSTANKCAEVLATLVDVTGHDVNSVHVVGPNADNTLLCQYIASITGREITAGYTDSAAIGNIIVQAIAAGEIREVEEARYRQAKAERQLTFRPKKIA